MTIDESNDGAHVYTGILELVPGVRKYERSQTGCDAAALCMHQWFAKACLNVDWVHVKPELYARVNLSMHASKS